MNVPCPSCKWAEPLVTLVASKMVEAEEGSSKVSRYVYRIRCLKCKFEGTVEIPYIVRTDKPGK